MADWEKIKAEYIKGGTSYRKLCDKYDVSFGTLKRRAGLEKWADLREQCSQKANTKIVNIETDKKVDRYKRVADVADKLLGLIEKAIDKTDAGEIVIDKSAFKYLSGAIKDIRDTLGAKPELDIEEQKAKIAIMKKQADSDNNTPNSIVVTISGGEETWQA